MHEFVESDPSDYSMEEAMDLARAEFPKVDLNDVQDRSAYWQKRGYAKPILIGDFLDQDYRVEFLVDRCVVKNASCIIAGASKSFKTTISLHLALALAAGSDFLGEFRTQQTPVLFASAESGEATLQRNLRGMADAMDIKIDELIASEAMSLQFWVPRISNVELMEHFEACIDETDAKVVVLDPLYLAMDGETQSSLSLNGEQIQKLMRLILDKGATPIVDDHVKRSSGNAKEYKPIQLEDITGAGKAESFRQWILLGRRSRYEDDDSDSKLHELWMTVGGSAGHSATWGLDVTENFSSDYEHVQYSLTLTPGSEVRKALKVAQRDKQCEREARKAAAAQKTLEAKCDKVEAEFRRKPEGLWTRTDIRAIARVSGDKANEIIFELVSTGRIAKHPNSLRRGNNQCEAWQLPGTGIIDFVCAQNDGQG